MRSASVVLPCRARGRCRCFVAPAVATEGRLAPTGFTPPYRRRLERSAASHRPKETCTLLEEQRAVGYASLRVLDGPCVECDLVSATHGRAATKAGAHASRSLFSSRRQRHSGSAANLALRPWVEAVTEASTARSRARPDFSLLGEPPQVSPVHAMGKTATVRRSARRFVDRELRREGTMGCARRRNRGEGWTRVRGVRARRRVLRRCGSGLLLPAPSCASSGVPAPSTKALSFAPARKERPKRATSTGARGEWIDAALRALRSVERRTHAPATGGVKDHESQGFIAGLELA
jgi:hypothetical protein